MHTVATGHYTVPEAARLIGAAAWAVRLTADALTPPVPRAGLYRIIPADRIDELKAELRRRGYLPAEGAAHAS